MVTPSKPCPVCGGAWYWPGDLYQGKKEWTYKICHPPVEGEGDEAT